MDIETGICLIRFGSSAAADVESIRINEFLGEPSESRKVERTRILERAPLKWRIN
jgi:hypothetical protein